MYKYKNKLTVKKGMKDGEYFLWRLIQSVMSQTYKDYEIVIVQEGTMPQNTNAGMRKATGELIKILYLDDYFAHDNALKKIKNIIMKKEELEQQVSQSR